MSEEEIVDVFCRAVNGGLARELPEDTALDAACAAIGAEATSSELGQQLVATFRQATKPRTFYNQRTLTPDLLFEQCDTLLRESFDPAELDPKERLALMLERLKDPTHTYPIVLMGRLWRVSGPQGYDLAGRLVRFGFDPLTVTESIVSSFSGHYMSLQPLGRPKQSIGAIGNLVTRERFRGGQGHGAALIQAFEHESVRIAAARGERLELYVLEAQEESQGFWYKLGYRWPGGTRYAQPPLEFDPTTGERLHDEVPETLMVKIPGKPGAASVDARLLTDAVRIMYLNWCLAETKTFPSVAARRAEEYVMGKVLGEFRESLPAKGASVPLVAPPSLK